MLYSSLNDRPNRQPNDWKADLILRQNKRRNKNDNYYYFSAWVNWCSSAGVVDKILFHLHDVHETLLESINKNILINLLVNKTIVHKSEWFLSWFHFVYPKTKQFQNQTGWIQNFQSTEPCNIFSSKRNNHERTFLLLPFQNLAVDRMHFNFSFQGLAE